MQRPISSRVHGMIDYPAGIALIAAPAIFGFTDVGGAAVTVPRVLGVVLIVQSLITAYEYGLVKLMPLPLHLTIDLIGGLLLALTPLIWNTTDQGTGAWLPHVVVGIGLIVAASLTQLHAGEPRETTPGRRAPVTPGSAHHVH